MDGRVLHSVRASLPSMSMLLMTLVLGILISILLVSIYRVFFHPLAKYPGPLRYKLSSWPMVSQCYKGNQHLYNLRDHEKYGPIVRTTPNTLHFTSASALHAIYGSKTVNVRKSSFYETLDAGAGALSTHTEIDKEKHGARRRVLSHAFSDAALREAEGFVLENVRKFTSLIGPADGDGAGEKEGGGWSEPRNMCDWANWLAFDIMGDLAFGKRFNLLESDENRYMPVALTEGTKFGYWFAYLPGVALLRPFINSPWMQWLGGQQARDNAVMTENAITQFEERAHAEKTGKATRKDFMHWLLNSADPKTGRRPTESELKADSLLLIGAGADTVASTTSATLFYLVRNPHTLARATDEVRAVFQSADDIRSGAALDRCAYLLACIEETLRLAGPVASAMPREVLRGGLRIDGHHVPAGTVVGVPHYVLHHDAGAFPDPWRFRPERWIAGGPSGEFGADAVERARRAMGPFSHGSRGCIGKKLAYAEVKIALAHLLWRYDVREADGEKVGGGGQDLEEGRQRVDEYQLFDCFGAGRDGPVLQFKRREGL